MLLKQARIEQYLVPPGPAGQYSSAEELIHWLKRNCELYGEFYQASVYGSKVYVISSPEY
jgi:hypothetical protein